MRGNRQVQITKAPGQEIYLALLVTLHGRM